MYQQNIRIKINSYFKSSSKKQIPKFVSIPFLALLIGFGLDFGFIKVLNKKYRTFVRYLATVISAIFFLSLVISIKGDNDSLTLLIYCIAIIIYCIHLLILYTAKYNLYDVIMDIYKIHSKIYEMEYRFLSCVMAYYLIMSLKLLFLVWSGLREMVITSQTIPFAVQVLAMDVVTAAQILIYYYVYASLKFLRKFVQKENLGFKNVRKQFMMIADCCDKISALYGTLVSITIHFLRGVFKENPSPHAPCMSPAKWNDL